MHFPIFFAILPQKSHRAFRAHYHAKKIGFCRKNRLFTRFRRKIRIALRQTRIRLPAAQFTAIPPKCPLNCPKKHRSTPARRTAAIHLAYMKNRASFAFIVPCNPRRFARNCQMLRFFTVIRSLSAPIPQMRPFHRHSAIRSVYSPSFTPFCNQAMSETSPYALFIGTFLTSERSHLRDSHVTSVPIPPPCTSFSSQYDQFPAAAHVTNVPIDRQMLYVRIVPVRF